MLDEQIMIGTRGILVSPPEQNGLELNGHLLQDGEWLELRVFGFWIGLLPQNQTTILKDALISPQQELCTTESVAMERDCFPLLPQLCHMS